MQHQSFNIEIALPTGRKVRVRELKNKEYLTIVKFCQNEDLAGLSMYLDELFIDPHLNIVERFYIFLYIRMMFIEADIVLIKNEREIKIDIASMLDKIESSYINLKRTVKEGGIEVTLDLPRASYFKSVDDLYISTISQIKTGDNCIKFADLSDAEQIKIMDNLPASIFNHIQGFLTSVQENLLDVALIEKNESLDIDGIDINIIGNGVMGFISIIYNSNLESFYNLLYIFQNTILPGTNLFFNLSPVETQIIFNNHQKKIQEENAQLQKRMGR